MRIDRRSRRSGVTLVEGALVFGILVTLVVSALDMTIAIHRAQLIEESAQHTARQAIVRGSRASELGSWGPTTVGPISASDSSDIAQTARSKLVSMDPSSVTVLVEWPDGSNEPGDRVRVTVSTQYTHVWTWLYGGSQRTLTSTSVMRISH